MEVNAKILWMKTITTLAINHFLGTIEQHVGSALDGIEVDLFDLILGLLITLDLISVLLIRPLNLIFSTLFRCFYLTFFDLKQTSLTSRNIVIALFVLRSIRSFIFKFGLLEIRSKADTPNPNPNPRHIDFVADKPSLDEVHISDQDFQVYKTRSMREI